ncbi:RNA polymerase sigma factor [Chloroflexota bacterium]
MFDRFISGNRKSKEAGSEADSSDLILRLSKGDTAAIEELYNLYFDRIYSMVYNRVGRNHDNAEEVVQEIWLAVIKSAKKFKGKSSPYTWICSIAAHKITDYQRRSYRDNAMVHKPSTNPEIPELQLIDSNPLPEELIEKKETKEVVRMALDSLPSHYQQVLTLKYIEELSAKEVGQVLGKSKKSVESLLDRAKLALRNEIVDMSR